MHGAHEPYGFMASCSFFDLGKAVGSRPLTVGRREDCLVGKGAGAALPDGGQSLIESVVVKEAEDDHRGWKLGTVIAAFSRSYVFDAGKDAQGLIVVRTLYTFQADAQREQRHLQFQELVFCRGIKK